MKPLKPWQDDPITPEQEDLLHSETWEKIRENEVRELQQTVQNALQGFKPKRKPPPKPKLRTWPGSVLSFAQKIEADFRAGKIPARSREDAFRQACQQWQQSNGRLFTPHSLRNSLTLAHNKTLGKQRP